LKIAHPGWRRTLPSLNDIKHLRANYVTRPNNGILRRNNGFSASPVAEIPLIWPRSTKNQRIVNHSRSLTTASALPASPRKSPPPDDPVGRARDIPWGSARRRVSKHARPCCCASLAGSVDFLTASKAGNHRTQRHRAFRCDRETARYWTEWLRKRRHSSSTAGKYDRQPKGGTDEPSRCQSRSHFRRRARHRRRYGPLMVEAARALIGWSATTLAERSGVSYPTIQRAEGVDGTP
jgi:hypothetical protein